MPLYEYQCESCDHRFEKIVKYSDPPIDTCPKCGTGPVRKLFSSPAIQFKGSGFYITDYAKKSSTDAGTSGGTSSSSEKSEKSEPGAKADSSTPSTSDSSSMKKTSDSTSTKKTSDSSPTKSTKSE